jgi:hypothetical protein
VLALLLASGCGNEGVTPPASAWATHATLQGRVFGAGLVVVPGARVFVSTIYGNESLSKFAIDTITSNATGDFELTIKRDAGTPGHPQPSLYLDLAVTAKQSDGTVVAAGLARAVKFGPITDAAPINRINMLPPQ